MKKYSMKNNLQRFTQFIKKNSNEIDNISLICILKTNHDIVREKNS